MVVKRQPENGFLTVSGCLIIGKIGVKKIKTCANRAELIAAIRTALDRYLAEFADIPEQAKDIRAAAGEKRRLSIWRISWVGRSCCCNRNVMSRRAKPYTRLPRAINGINWAICISIFTKAMAV